MQEESEEHQIRKLQSYCVTLIRIEVSSYMEDADYFKDDDEEEGKNRK